MNRDKILYQAIQDLESAIDQLAVARDKLEDGLTEAFGVAAVVEANPFVTFPHGRVTGCGGPLDVSVCQRLEGIKALASEMIGAVRWLAKDQGDRDE